jgi:hypothetical protein
VEVLKEGRWKINGQITVSEAKKYSAKSVVSDAQCLLFRSTIAPENSKRGRGYIFSESSVESPPRTSLKA